MSFTYPYPRPALTVDAVIFLPSGGTVRLLLIKRENDPFKGQWALPGGFVDIDELIDDAAVRELKEETGLSDIALQQIGIFDALDRDPRERIISVGYYGITDDTNATLAPNDDAADARWFALNDLPPLGFDHAEIIRRAQEMAGFEPRF